MQRLVGRSGEPVIRQALRRAMRILGSQFVLGQTISEALANAADEAAQGYRFSFDMLGEAARTREDAVRHAARYQEAAEAIADWAGPPQERDDDALQERPGLSVKLSALHPRYEPSQAEMLRVELMPPLCELARTMRDAWLPLTIDAEEAAGSISAWSSWKRFSPIPRCEAGMDLVSPFKPTASECCR